ncbi:MAG: COX15/CtaA family protein [Candidatus Hermodarchaeota archaeon]
MKILETWKTPRTYLILAYITPIMIFLLMIWGNFASAIGAGLACPDWPLCLGQLIPLNPGTIPLELVIAEFLHRLLALCTVIVVLLLVISSYYHRNTSPRLFRVAILIIALLMLQIFLGGLLIYTGLTNALASTSHLAFATAAFGLSIIQAIWIPIDLNIS